MNKSLWATIVLALSFSGAALAQKTEPTVVMKFTIDGSEEGRLEPFVFLKKANDFRHVGPRDCDGGTDNWRIGRKMFANGYKVWLYIGGRQIGSAMRIPRRYEAYPTFVFRGLDPTKDRKVLASNYPDLGHDYDGRLQVTESDQTGLFELLRKDQALENFKILGSWIDKRRLSKEYTPFLIGGWEVLDIKTVRSHTYLIIAADKDGTLVPEYIQKDLGFHSHDVDQIDIDRDGFDEIVLVGSQSIFKRTDGKWKLVLHMPGFVCE